MFNAYMESFFTKHGIRPKDIHSRYVCFEGNKCKIRIWSFGKVDICLNRKSGSRYIRSFLFDEKRIAHYMLKEDKNEKV